MKHGDRILIIVLAIVLIGSAVAVTLEFLRPSGQRENLDAMVQDCLAIIAAAQKWQVSSHVVGGAERKGWSELTFDKIGYEPAAEADLRTMKNDRARYSIRVAPDGSSFDLLAEGKLGRVVIYRNVNEGTPPDPEIR